MPLMQYGPELWKSLISRVLIFGPPNSFKTTSLLTWLSKGPLHILSFPGESGYTTIPLGVTGLTASIWQNDFASPASVVDEIERKTLEIVSGKSGPVVTAAFDGFHKYYTALMNDITGGAYSAGEEFEPRLYSKGHMRALRFIQQVNQSKVPYVVFTAWDGREADKPGQIKSESHVWPALPGMMAKLILGEFSVTVFSKVTYPRNPGEKIRGEWVLKPDHEVWGTAVKIDPRVAAQLPARCGQSWQELEPLLLDAYQKGLAHE